MIDHSLRFIFVHIPKTGGNSINRVFGVDWEDHKDISKYAQELSPEILRTYFKFAIVRNPWERLFSDYNYQIKKSRPKSSKLFLFTETGDKRRFCDWVKTALANPYLYDPQQWGGQVSPGLHRWSPQVDWISIDGTIAVDAVVPMETLPTGFSQICRQLGTAPRRLPVRNRRRHWHYSWYYDEVTRKRVAEYYAQDIREFNYHFVSHRAQMIWNYFRNYSFTLNKRELAYAKKSI